MSVASFIPEIWSAALLSNLQDALVYAQGGVTNRNYEGEVRQAGDTVHVNQVGAVTVNDYHTYGYDEGEEQDAPVSYERLTTTGQTITVAQKKYFAFQVDDVDRRQALDGFVAEATREAAYAMARAIDGYVSGVMAAGATALTGGGTATIEDPDSAYDLLVDLRTQHQNANTPSVGRWVIVPPEFYAYLLRDDRFISAEKAGTTAGLRNGFVGRAAGFDVIESNTVPTTQGGAPIILSGTAASTTFIQQIASMEALRLESAFADAVRGLHLFDAAVLNGRAANLVKVEVTLS
jgi:N4-gp56 family major capsid protein